MLSQARTDQNATVLEVSTTPTQKKWPYDQKNRFLESEFSSVNKKYCLTFCHVFFTYEFSYFQGKDSNIHEISDSLKSVLWRTRWTFF